MYKIEARKWQSLKENFNQYRQAGVNALFGLTNDGPYLLMGGITQASLRATALSLKAEYDRRLPGIDEMHCAAETEKKTVITEDAMKRGETACKNCSKKNHTQGMSRETAFTVSRRITRPV